MGSEVNGSFPENLKKMKYLNFLGDLSYFGI